MHGIMAALLSGALGALGLALAPATTSPAPDPEAEIKACQDRCDASVSETDGATCRLNCRHAVKGKDKAHVIRWTEERSVGSTVPGQAAPSPTKKTVTKVTPRGTITETTSGTPSTSAGSGPPPSSALRDTTAFASPRHRYYYGLVDCQDRCNTHKMGGDRARCKLRCFRQHPGPPPPATVAAPSVTKRKAHPVTAPSTAPATKKSPAAPTVDCSAQCAGETNEDDRMTCEEQCRDTIRRRSRPTTKVQTKTKTVVIPPADCRRRCQSKATSCRSGCGGDGSDGSTCQLQCDEAARSCEKRCG